MSRAVGDGSLSTIIFAVGTRAGGQPRPYYTDHNFRLYITTLFVGSNSGNFCDYMKKDEYTLYTMSNVMAYSIWIDTIFAFLYMIDVVSGRSKSNQFM